MSALILLTSLPGVCHAQKQVTYYYSDPLGTPLATADAAGNLLTTIDYKPFGAVAVGAPVAGPAYTGHVVDDDTALIYMQRRYYDPEIARFISTDPVRLSSRRSERFSPYTYVRNNPYKYVDPDGKVTVAAGLSGTAAAFGGGTITIQQAWSFPSLNPATWTAGIYVSVGGVASNNVAAGVNVIVSGSAADSVDDMADQSGLNTTGGAVNALLISAGYERSVCSQCTPIQSLTFGLKSPSVPIEVHTSVTKSWGFTLFGTPVRNTPTPDPTVTVGQAPVVPGTPSPPLPPPPPKADQ